MGQEANPLSLGEKSFMDFDRLIGFVVNAQMLRDGVKEYLETQLSTLIPNLYTEKFAEIVNAFDSLVHNLQDEVAARSEQLGIEEGVHKVKPQYAPPKKRKRRKTKKQIKLRKTKI